MGSPAMVAEAVREKRTVAGDEQQQAVVAKVVWACVAADEAPRKSPCLFIPMHTLLEVGAAEEEESRSRSKNWSSWKRRERKRRESKRRSTEAGQ